MHFSVQPRDRIYAKGYGFLSFPKHMGKNIAKNISKKLIYNVVNIVKNFTIMLKYLLQRQLNLLQKE